MKTLNRLIVTFTVLPLSLPGWADKELAGRTTVIDGDIVELHGQRIRLAGIDAPESSQLCWSGDSSWRCGQKAALALSDKIGSRPISCSSREKGRYKRHIATCYLGDEDLNRWLVEEGCAVAYVKYSRKYEAQEEVARSAQKGVWGSEFVTPHQWRKGKRLHKQ